GLLLQRQAALVDWFRSRIAALIDIERGQIVEDCAELGMVRAEQFFADRQRTLVQRLGIGIAAQVRVEQAKVAQGCGDVAMLGPERLLKDGEAAPEKR